MSGQGWLVLALVGAAFAVLLLTRLRAHWVMLATLVVLIVSGVLSSGEALAGFSNPGLITVAALFIVAGGVHASGGIDLLVNHLLGKPRNLRSALLRLFAPVAVLSAFLNNTPVVATLIPALHTWSRKISIPASKLMIPLSFATILGGTTTLIGTSTNLVVNAQYQQLTGAEGFSLFSITLLGLPVALVGLLFMWLFFPRWLPDNSHQSAFSNLREFTLEIMVDPNGPLVGKSVQEAGLRHLSRVYLVEILRNDAVVTAVASEEKLQAGDRLVFVGDTEAISDLLRIRGIVPSPSGGDFDLFDPRSERCLVEAVVSPHCQAVGLAIREARFRDRYGAVVLAVARHGERVSGNLGNIHLMAGDLLLLEARPAFVSRQRFNKDFLLINDLQQEAPRHHRASLAWVILLAMIVSAAFGWLDVLSAALVAASLMLVCGCCSLSQAERSVDFPVLITIGAAFALGEAFTKTGVAVFFANHIVAFSDGRPWLLLLLTYFTISVLTELITNNAAAILMLPIVVAITAAAQLNPTPFVFAIMMAASASFATPLGYQTNLMVYGPGNYRFSDFLRVGIPMNLVVGAATILLIIAIWPLTLA